MPKFYITYSGGSNLKNNYSIIEGADYPTARTKVFQVTRGRFAFMYDEKSFLPQITMYHLTEVPMQAQVILEYPAAPE